MSNSIPKASRFLKHFKTHESFSEILLRPISELNLWYWTVKHVCRHYFNFTDLLMNKIYIEFLESLYCIWDKLQHLVSAYKFLMFVVGRSFVCLFVKGYFWDGCLRIAFCGSTEVDQSRRNFWKSWGVYKIIIFHGWLFSRVGWTKQVWNCEDIH
jgi:hypothetical protein